MQFVVFSKHLQEWPIEKALREAGRIGLDGLDLTVRPGGHIEPQDAATQLPGALATARDMGLDIPMITTAITRGDTPGADETFAACAELGIRHLKLGYWTYEGFGNFRTAIKAARADIETVVPLALKHRVCACVHNHSGNFVTANACVTSRLIEDLDPDAIGTYPDPAHLVVEGSYDVWRQGLELLLDRARMIAVKSIDSRVVREDGLPRHESQVVPLEDGPVNYKLVFEYARRTGFDGTVSLHGEYSGLPAEQVIERTKRDWEYLRRFV